jgi:hypothetical protein
MGFLGSGYNNGVPSVGVRPGGPGHPAAGPVKGNAHPSGVGLLEVGQFRLLPKPHLAERGIHHLAALDAQAIRIAEHARAAQVVAVPS